MIVVGTSAQAPVLSGLAVSSTAAMISADIVSMELSAVVDSGLTKLDENVHVIFHSRMWLARKFFIKGPVPNIPECDDVSSVACVYNSCIIFHVCAARYFCMSNATY